MLFLGGLDTTRSAIGTIAMHIAMQPELEARVRDPRWVRNDMDEFIRHASPVATFGRTVTRDTEVGGCPMRKGDRVLVRFDSANRDEEKFPNADQLQFDPPRGGNAGFGLGIHRCVGMHLARVEITIAFEELLARDHQSEIRRRSDRTQVGAGDRQLPRPRPSDFRKSLNTNCFRSIR